MRVEQVHPQEHGPLAALAPLVQPSLDRVDRDSAVERGVRIRHQELVHALAEARVPGLQVTGADRGRGVVARRAQPFGQGRGPGRQHRAVVEHPVILQRQSGHDRHVGRRGRVAGRPGVGEGETLEADAVQERGGAGLTARAPAQGVGAGRVERDQHDVRTAVSGQRSEHDRVAPVDPGALEPPASARVDRRSDLAQHRAQAQIQRAGGVARQVTDEHAPARVRGHLARGEAAREDVLPFTLAVLDVDQEADRAHGPARCSGQGDLDHQLATGGHDAAVVERDLEVRGPHAARLETERDQPAVAGVTLERIRAGGEGDPSAAHGVQLEALPAFLHRRDAQVRDAPDPLGVAGGREAHGRRRARGVEANRDRVLAGAHRVGPRQLGHAVVIRGHVDLEDVQLGGVDRIRGRQQDPLDTPLPRARRRSFTNGVAAQEDPTAGLRRQLLGEAQLPRTRRGAGSVEIGALQPRDVLGSEHVRRGFTRGETRVEVRDTLGRLAARAGHTQEGEQQRASRRAHRPRSMRVISAGKRRGSDVSA